MTAEEKMWRTRPVVVEIEGDSEQPPVRPLSPHPASTPRSLLLCPLFALRESPRPTNRPTSDVMGIRRCICYDFDHFTRSYHLQFKYRYSPSGLTSLAFDWCFWLRDQVRESGQDPPRDYVRCKRTEGFAITTTGPRVL